MPYNISMSERIRKSCTDLLHKIRYCQVYLKSYYYLDEFLLKSCYFIYIILLKSCFLGSTMLYRKIGSLIEEPLKNNSKKILLIDSARQVGKTYII